MTRRHSVYVNRMLVDHGPSPVVPAWAFFVECEINSTCLSPTASREALVEDEALAATRDHVAQRIRSWLLDLGRRTPHRLSDRGIIPPHTKVEVAIEERSVRALKPGSDQT